jgi:hypothetical protein
MTSEHVTRVGGYLIHDDDVNRYLTTRGYKTAEEWAADSDYRYDKNSGVWSNDDGQPVDIHAQLLAAIETLLDDIE